MSLPFGTISQFPRRYSRREMLRLLGWGSAVCLAADGAHPLWSAAPAFGQPTAGRAVPACVVRPEQTEGPYFVDEMLNRSDIRSDPSDGAISQGAPLDIVFNVSQINANGCAALPAYAIKLEQPAYISAVQLYAHDQVGPSRWSELVVKVNGRPVGSAQVHRYGSTRTIEIGRVGQLVTIESRHYHNGFLRGGEEAVIWDVYLLGRKPH